MSDLIFENGADPVYISATATTASANTSVIAVLGSLYNAGAYNITFTFTRVNDDKEIAVVLPPGFILDEPWRFKKVAYATATSTSTFYLYGSMLPKGVKT